jgi:hypothetical protein
MVTETSQLVEKLIRNKKIRIISTDGEQILVECIIGKSKSAIAFFCGSDSFQILINGMLKVNFIEHQNLSQNDVYLYISDFIDIMRKNNVSYYECYLPFARTGKLEPLSSITYYDTPLSVLVRTVGLKKNKGKIII